MKAIRGHLAALLAALSWVIGPGIGQAEGLTRGLLFEVTGGGPLPSYLFGTFHSDDPRVVSLPPPVQVAFDAAEGFAMEAIPDPEAVDKARLVMVFGDGRRLRHLAPDIYARRWRRRPAGASPPRPSSRSSHGHWSPFSAPHQAAAAILDLILYRLPRTRESP